MKLIIRKQIPLVCLFFMWTLAANAQTGGITLTFRNTPTSAVLESIEKQVGKTFFYEENVIDPKKNVTISVTDATLKTTLDHLFGNTVVFSETETQIILKKATVREARTSAQSGTARTSAGDTRSSGNNTTEQQQTSRQNIVKGSVKNFNTGEGMPGVVVNVKGTNVYAVTDANSQFSIDAPDNSRLVFTFMGMIPQEIDVRGRTNITVEMNPDTFSLQEVIVTGYQVISRERATGSFTTVSLAQLDDKIQPDLQSMMEGQIAGLNIDKDGKIEIRGVSTFSASRSPLVVVDGFPIDATLNDSEAFGNNEGILGNLNPDNIQSITVLKDGVAASIYGSRAANGVIVISTKRGSHGPAKVSYKGTFGIKSKPDLGNLHKASASDYIDAQLNFFEVAPSDYKFSTYWYGASNRVNYLLTLKNNGLLGMSEAEMKAEINSLRNNDYMAQADKYLYRPEFSHQHNISINGGSDKHSYNFSVNYTGTRENFVHAKSSRLIADFNDQWKLNDWVTVGATMNLVYNASETPAANGMGLFTFDDYSVFSPYTILKDENGNAADVSAYNYEERYTYDMYSDRIKDTGDYLLDDLKKDMIKTSDVQSRLSAFVRVNIIEGLSAEVGGNWQRGNYQWKNEAEYNSYKAISAYNNGTSMSNPSLHHVPEGGIVDERRGINDSWTVRSQINFNRNFNNDKHRVTALVGNEIRRITYDNNSYETRLGYNAVAGTFEPVNIKNWKEGEGTSDMILGTPSLEYGSYSFMDTRFVSWYANGSYEYNNRYIVSGSVRLDLTNFFGTDKKYRYKPMWSVGGTWKLSEENFINADWLNRLDIRGSYGVNGNIALDQGPFLIIGVKNWWEGSWSTDTGGTFYSVLSAPNDQLRWEKTTVTNVGFDLTAFNSRLNLSLDYYYKNSTDLLAPDNWDPTTGFSNVTRNVGRITNKGIEVTLNVEAIRTRNFRWNITHNFAYNKNMVESYNVVRNYSSQYAGGNPINAEGYPADGLWAFKFAKIDNEGNMWAYNSDGESVPIAEVDNGPSNAFYMGSARPKFDLSLTNRFSYRNFDLSFMLVAKLGHKFFKDNFSGSNIDNRHVSERWQKPGDEDRTIYPAIKADAFDYWFTPFMDIYIGNASFMKLRDLTLSYTFNKNAAKKMGMTNAKIYFQARNLFTVTAKGVDIDPESFAFGSTEYSETTSGYAGFARPREFYFGLQITF